MTAARRLLSEEQLAVALRELPQWERRGDRLVRTFQFDDFQQAFGFMAAAALRAEKLDHHPEWSNVYGRVEVQLTTHETPTGRPGLTRLDVELAQAMDRLAAGFAPPS
ncbi:MAG: 4a-hydroxytetrahydrobiopterin dehydratase [Planctomycetota bacterium]